MRSPVEAPPPPYLRLEDLELQVRHIGADLIRALRAVPTVDQVVLLDQELVKDVRWHIAEALRLNIDYRRRLVGRLAGSTTPAQGSPPQSLHDPPPHVTPGIPQSTGEPSPP